MVLMWCELTHERCGDAQPLTHGAWPNEARVRMRLQRLRQDAGRGDLVGLVDDPVQHLGTRACEDILALDRDADVAGAAQKCADGLAHPDAALRLGLIGEDGVRDGDRHADPDLV